MDEESMNVWDADRERYRQVRVDYAHGSIESLDGLPVTEHMRENVRLNINSRHLDPLNE